MPDIEYILETFEQLNVDPIVYVTEWHTRSCSPYAFTIRPQRWTYDPEVLAQQYEAVMIEHNIKRWIQGNTLGY